MQHKSELILTDRIERMLVSCCHNMQTPRQLPQQINPQEIESSDADTVK